MLLDTEFPNLKPQGMTLRLFFKEAVIISSSLARYARTVPGQNKLIRMCSYMGLELSVPAGMASLVRHDN